MYENWPCGFPLKTKVLSAGGGGAVGEKGPATVKQVATFLKQLFSDFGKGDISASDFVKGVLAIHT